MKPVLSVLAFVSFTAFSTWVIVQHGPLGFLPAAFDGAWGTQVFLDLVISLSLAMGWLIPHAKKRGINPWPFVVACVPLGSISALAYLAYSQTKPSSV
jgi:hypothetical protein